MVSAAARIAHFNARMTSSQVDPTLTAVNTLQQNNYASYMADYYPFQVALRAWLDAQSYHGALAFGFEAFNNEMYSAYRRFSGAAFIAQATVLVDKYEDFAIARVDLIAVCLNVWSIVVV